MLSIEQLKIIIEVCLLTSDEFISQAQLLSIFSADQAVTKSHLELAIEQLATDYTMRGFELITLNNAYRLRSKHQFQNYLNKLHQNRPPRYSRAVMETLAVIAYRQPITRGEIENVRGVSLNSLIIQTLLEREWIEVVGHKQVPGRPELLATTSKFLHDLGLNNLQELPPLPELSQSFTDNLPLDFIEEYDKNKELP